ncbi:MAG: anti-anti-sigma factor [Candidatus Cloacimonetes bacterium 4572_55]|nr:MAG: anti-anti-sigma factor [Candidatus Cloacimonetes bacterium 4572_55]
MAEFSSSIKYQSNVAIISVKGFIDAHTAPSFEKVLADLTSAGRFKIVIDFGGLQYISSAGLGVLMGQIEYIRENNGDIKLVNLSKKVYKVFDLLGFTTLYETFDDIEGGVKSFLN